MKKKAEKITDFYDFVATVSNDRKLAAQMLADNRERLQEKSSVGETALHYLAIENDLEGVTFLISQGAEVDSRDNSNCTPLMHAAQLGNDEMCLLLMEHGADVNAIDDLLNYTPLHYAASAGDAELLEAMLSDSGRADARAEFGKSVADVVLPRKRTLLLDVLKKYGYS